MEQAARLVAEDRLTDVEVAAECGVTDRTLYKWKKREEFIASRLVHKYRYTLIGLGPSIWLRMFIQISDPALETRLDFSGSP